MSRLWLPPKVEQEHRDNTARFAQAIRNATHEDAVCRKWNREFARLDPLLRMVKSDHGVVGTPLVAGAYHWLRANPGAPMTVTPIVDGHGRPLPEPPGRLLEELKRVDLQNDSAARWRQRIVEEERRREDRRRELIREQRQDEILERWKAVSETRVSMSDAEPWSQNVAGRRKKKEKGVAGGSGAD